MHNKSCAISREYAGKKYIINCAGEKVPISDTGFTSRCAIGNTDDYLKSFKDYINPEIVSLGEPALISVVVPSYASENDELCETLLLLCSQKYPVSTEILVFINEPKNATKGIEIINERNENFIRFLINPASNNISSKLSKLQKRLLVALSRSRRNVALGCVRQVLSGGLAGVYQTVTASLIARTRTYCDSLVSNGDRQKKINRIEGYLQRSMLLLCDDDMEIKDTGAVAKAYEYVVNKDAIVLGRLYIKHVETIGKYNRILRDLMQLFLDFKS